MSRLINYLSFFVSIFFLGFLFAQVQQIHPAPKPYPTHAHITLYLDRNFDDFEQETIISAAMEWTETTNHIIEYDVVQLPTLGSMDLENGVFITKITPDHPSIILLDQTNKNTTLGYFDINSYLPHIAIVSDRIRDTDYRAVILHELGHSLGLSHNEGVENIGTLMFPTIDLGSAHITMTDGKKFCKLYHCDPMKLKYQEESFHP